VKIEILNWLGPPWEADEGGVKRIKGDEPIGVVIYIYIYIYMHGTITWKLLA
jgi:hypothetical protein